MKQERASKKQLELFTFVKDFISSNGFGPSYREIMSGLGYKSVSTVAIHVDALIAKGYLQRRDKSSARSLEIADLSTKPKAGTTQPELDVERVLVQKWRELTLNDDQSATVQRAFEILGYSNAATELKKKDQDETATG